MLSFEIVYEAPGVDWSVWAPIISFAIATVATVVARLVDRFLPDTTGTHPLPDVPDKPVSIPPVVAVGPETYKKPSRTELIDADAGQVAFVIPDKPQDQLAAHGLEPCDDPTCFYCADTEELPPYEHPRHLKEGL